MSGGFTPGKHGSSTAGGRQGARTSNEVSSSSTMGATMCCARAPALPPTGNWGGAGPYSWSTDGGCRVGQSRRSQHVPAQERTLLHRRTHRSAAANRHVSNNAEPNDKLTAHADSSTLVV